MSDISTISYLKFLNKSGISSFLQDKPNNFYNNKENNSTKQVSNKIGEINTIQDLDKFIRNFDLSANKTHIKNRILWEGNKKADIMIIGNPPGQEEEKEGLPFVGNSSNLLNKMLRAINIEKKDVYITNITPSLLPSQKKIREEQIYEFLQIIQRQIEIINPRIILLLGSVSTKAILNSNTSFDSLRGKWHDYKSVNHQNTIRCLATHEPSLLLKSPNLKKESWEDLKIFKKKIIDEKL